MSTPFICVKCEKEIKPGDQVDYVYGGEGEPRIVLDDEMIVVHMVCPKSEP